MVSAPLRCCGFSARVKSFVLQSLTLAKTAAQKKTTSGKSNKDDNKVKIRI